MFRYLIFQYVNILFEQKYLTDEIFEFITFITFFDLLTFFVYFILFIFLYHQFYVV